VYVVGGVPWHWLNAEGIAPMRYSSGSTCCRICTRSPIPATIEVVVWNSATSNSSFSKGERVQCTPLLPEIADTPLSPSAGPNPPNPAPIAEEGPTSSSLDWLLSILAISRRVLRDDIVSFECISVVSAEICGLMWEIYGATSYFRHPAVCSQCQFSVRSRGTWLGLSGSFIRMFSGSLREKVPCNYALYTFYGILRAFDSRKRPLSQ